MKKIYLSMLAAMMSLASFAQVTYTCTAGQNFGGNEGCQRIFDGNTNTKWCTGPGDGAYALFTASEAVHVWGYEFTTANDNSSYGRKPTEWHLYGTNDEAVAADANSAEWTQISTQANNCIQSKNYETYRFYSEGDVDAAYKYFKLVINRASDGLFQISKFQLLAETTRPVTFKWVEGDDKTDKVFDKKLDVKMEGNDLNGKKFIIETYDEQPHSLIDYEFTTHDDGNGGCNNRAPKNWTIEGSNDKSKWFVVDHVTDGQIEDQNFKHFEYTPTADEVAFRYYRVTLNSFKAEGWRQVAEFFALGGTPSAANVGYKWVSGDNDNLQKVLDMDSHSKAEGGQMPDGVKFTVQTNDEQAHTVKSYTLSTHDDGSYNNRAPKSWILEGSNNLTEWVTIDDVDSDPIENVNYDVKKFIPANQDAAVRYLRLTVRSFKGGYHQLAEFNAIGACETHNWILTSGKSATCVEDGGASYECSVCGAVKVLGHEPATGIHTYADGKCSVCGLIEGVVIEDGVMTIATAADLDAYSELSRNEHYSTLNAKVTADIVANDAFKPIGSAEIKYTRTFDGQGHSITLNIDTDQSYQALIGRANGGCTVKNLIVKGNVKSTGSKNAAVIAEAQGSGDVTIMNVGNEANVQGNGGETSAIIANNYGGSCNINLTNVYNTGSVSGSGDVAAICACYQRGTAKNVYSTGAVSGAKQGQFIRYAGTVTNCYTTVRDNNDNANVKAVTAEDVESGKLCYMLGEGFAQVLGRDAYPVFGDAHVYAFTVGEAGWRTLVAERGMNFPAIDGATAYHVIEVTDCVKLDGGVKGVPAGEAVLVEAAEGEYYYNACNPAGSPGNLLLAATEDITANGTQYVLAQVEGVVGFHKVTSGTTIAKGKGYLVIAAGAKTFFPFGDDDTTTSIEAVELIPADAAIYNVAGQKLQKLQKGVNIINGKKVMVK